MLFCDKLMTEHTRVPCWQRMLIVMLPSILLINVNYQQLWQGLKRRMGHIDALWGEWKGQRRERVGADRQNTLKIFIISFTGRNIWFHVLDIYSPPLWMLICSIWIFIHSIFGHSTRTYLFTWCSTNMFVHSICGNIYLFEFQHLSLLPLSGCWVPGFKCPSAVIWHFGDNTNQSHHDEDDKVDWNLFWSWQNEVRNTAWSYEEKCFGFLSSVITSIFLKIGCTNCCGGDLCRSFEVDHIWEIIFDRISCDLQQLLLLQGF